MWRKFAGFLVIGYSAMTRSFAYLGIPPLKLFIGEIALALFLFFKPRVVLGPLLRALVAPSPLNMVALAFVIFLSYGIWEMARGVAAGYSPIVAAQSLALNYYPLFLFVGLWVGRSDPDFLPRMIRVLAWVNGAYGVLYILFLRNTGFAFAGGVPVFGQPAGSVLALLGLISFERNLRGATIPLLLNGFVLLAMQVRAEWLALAVGLLVWATLTGRFGRVITGGLTVLVVLLAFELLEIRIPGRIGTISITETLSRVLTPIAPELARELFPMPSANHLGSYVFREQLWDGIWSLVHSRFETALLGMGYGFPMASVVPSIFAEYGERLRSPHNFFYYALCYLGWLGVVIFVAFQIAIGRLLWRAFRLTGQPFGVAYWAATLSNGLFSNLLENPFGATPFYVTVGMSLAPVLLTVRSRAPDPAPALHWRAARIAESSGRVHPPLLSDGGERR